MGDAQKVSQAEKLGAQEVILYKKDDFAEKVKKLTDGKGVDVICDHIGPEVWQKNISCLVRGGRFVTCGVTSGPKVELDLRYFYSRQLTLLGSYMGSFIELRRVLELVENGSIVPVVDEVFPLKEAAEAHRRMEERRNFGKIILKV